MARKIEKIMLVDHVSKNKKYKSLPTISYFEYIMFVNQVSKIGFSGSISIGKPKISDKTYIEMIKEAID